MSFIFPSVPTLGGTRSFLAMQWFCAFLAAYEHTQETTRRSNNKLCDKQKVTLSLIFEKLFFDIWKMCINVVSLFVSLSYVLFPVFQLSFPSTSCGWRTSLSVSPLTMGFPFLYNFFYDARMAEGASGVGTDWWMREKKTFPWRRFIIAFTRFTLFHEKTTQRFKTSLCIEDDEETAIFSPIQPKNDDYC